MSVLAGQRPGDRVVDVAAGIRLIENRRERQLPEVADAVDLLGLGFGFGKRRQQHAGENRDDGDDHQQFDQRERGQTGAGANEFAFHAMGQMICVSRLVPPNSKIIHFDHASWLELARWMDLT